MGELGMSGREYAYLTAAITESTKLLGQESYLYQVRERREDFYHDIKRDYLDPVKIGLLFVTNPQPILKRNHWLQENEEAYVGYISLHDIDYKPLKIEQGCLVEIRTKYPIVEKRIFKISIVQALTIDPLMWVAKLVPYRQHVDFQPESPVKVETTQKPSSFNSSLLKV